MARLNLWIAIFLVFALNIQQCCAVDASRLDVTPVAFLPGVTGTVQMTCRPPATEDISKVMTMQLSRVHDRSPGEDPIATYVTTGSPVVEQYGRGFRVSVSGSYDPRNQKAASLSVTLPNPTEAADGQYTCSVETLDSHGLLHRYLTHTSLVSLAKNGTVPVFYQAILQEMKTDLDNLTSDLHTVQQLHLDLTAGDNSEQAQLTSMAANGAKITDTVNEVSSLVASSDRTVSDMIAEIARLRNITPERPVYFYAYYASAAIAGYDVAGNVQFNTLQEATLDKAYSPSTYIFTAPQAGTYFFRTAVTGVADPTSATVMVNNQPMASLYTYDDYDVKQATACLVVELAVNDTVRVVRTSGAAILGSIGSMSYTRHTYFLGTLLWQ